MLLTGRFLVSAEWELAEENRYYWEHCFWVDDSDWDNHFQMNLAILTNMKLLYTTQVRFHGCRWYDPVDMSIVFQIGYTATTFGSQPAQTNYNLLIASRWRLYGFDGSYSYHLHRQPIGEDYLEGSTWSVEGYTQQLTRLGTFVSEDIYRTKTGSKVNVGNVGVVPVGWQLRHGTKRSQKRFWLP